VTEQTATVSLSAPDASLEADSRHPIRRALISVFNKAGICDLAAALNALGVEIVSTGSTASTMERAGIPVTPVESVTGFPECLEGRVKTLHPGIHAGILADTRKADHLAQLDSLGFTPFDLVIVNLYPFADALTLGLSDDEQVEQIDIGGPAMVRAAAKNHASVAVVVNPDQYRTVVDAAKCGGFTFAERAGLAAQAFAHTATYDTAVATWMAERAGRLSIAEAKVGTSDAAAGNDGTGDDAAGNVSGGDSAFPVWRGATYTRAEVLRYGENPHQSAALYVDGTTGLATAEQLGGKAMSYNNYMDADAAWRAAWDHTEPCVAVIKHANPCGIAVGADIAAAHAKAHATDPVSAFGGVIAANRPVTAEMAEQVFGVFTEVVIAPGFEADALEILQRKKNLRLLRLDPPTAHGGVETRPVSGGLLVQERDTFQAAGDDPAHWTLAAGPAVDSDTLDDLAFAWRAVRAAKSNAILLAHGGAAVGIGMGQVNRVDSCRLAVERANALGDGVERARGSVAASDAFFPFSDGPQVLIDAGVKAIVQPGGSKRDADTVAAANAAGVSVYFTGTRHFAH
jgi:phosphoribosylaminoimidazolecarboxamide formyltransferase/IMP cyclohydrolase